MSSNTVNIAISGVGGQGVLTLAELLAKAALNEGLNVRVGEIHGMAQRGGHVVCTVRIGDDAKGPIIDAGAADLLVGFEPVETLREIHLIKKGGYVLMSSNVQYPVAVSMGKAEYPDHKEILASIKKFTDKIIEINAQEIAIEAGSPRALNMVMFGGIIGTDLVPISKDSAMQAIREAFPKKFEKTNTTAAEIGLERVRSSI
ncbi:MAG: indolepyruvate oxidoreductase subunit beta [Candidatus Thorarchaeota archaeon]|nr:indolepyruvate oxidoreductase subunit beta [Candidatus Thorarchaeota archaeon]MCK5389498.1 indolepyruvate oxidoreductase subunit beta [Candidatus Thorarchaeota archaeon]